MNKTGEIRNQTDLGTGFGNGTQVIDQIGLGHTDTGVEKGKSATIGRWDELDFEFLLWVQLRWIGQGFVANLVKSL